MKELHLNQSFLHTISFFFVFRSIFSVAFVITHHCPTISWTSTPTPRHTRPAVLQSNVHMDGVAENKSSTPMETLRALVLHGSEEDAETFPRRLSAINEALLNHANMKLEITAVQAPFPKGSGYCWWTMPPGIRSFNAKKYEGFEESATKVLNVWKTAQNEYDIVLGHSQGAILIASLLALKRTPYHPKRGYILNGVGYPNPFTADIESLTTGNDGPSLNPRVLFILGRQDKITPNASGEQLRDALSKARFQVDSCYHEGGHGLPQLNNPESLVEIVRWIQE
jgi:predicted esterase